MSFWFTELQIAGQGWIVSVMNTMKLLFMKKLRSICELVPFITQTLKIRQSLRPFSNPANSPVENAREIGGRTWNGGEKGCVERRSLIEEAQEIYTDSVMLAISGGRKSLKSAREKGVNYRHIPSRNILIAHSMGGAASREYVQGDFYNGDVDKVITLDSPHEGTGSLNMLIDMNQVGVRTVYAHCVLFRKVQAGG